MNICWKALMLVVCITNVVLLCTLLTGHNFSFTHHNPFLILHLTVAFAGKTFQRSISRHGLYAQKIMLFISIGRILIVLVFSTNTTHFIWKRVHIISLCSENLSTRKYWAFSYRDRCCSIFRKLVVKSLLTPTTTYFFKHPFSELKDYREHDNIS